MKLCTRCSQIMGRNDTDDLSAAQIFYPCMQCADIFYLKVCLPAPGAMCPWHGSSQQSKAWCSARARTSSKLLLLVQ